ncbi:RICIN domain-containing protein [Actinokineospora diospyrosa]|uniref:Ricin-type beta-trefoil lectin domain-containing protein n=1 Tax=Actinokineospora diospyrosa TaxID=103728 RepID=A0ABT1IIM1_9PSEU|nr:RICIN domain-containing protein [Actinokineospora diospyrosa]MCP2272502.1 Ricin-type beta-trefoil lectin domain-containing protein [Actinokineospora diospyrosa]
MKARKVAGVVIGAVGLLAGGVLPASAGTDGVWHELRPLSSDKCLDVDGGSLEDGANVIQWSCHGGLNQQWQLVLVESDDIYQVFSAGSGKCLDVSGASTDNGASVIQWECHGDLNQQWQLIPGPGSTYELQAVHSGKCLDVTGADPADGVAVIQWECHGGDNQAWSITNV